MPGDPGRMPGDPMKGGRMVGVFMVLRVNTRGGLMVGMEHTGVESHELQILRRLKLGRFQRFESLLHRFLEPQ